jgi:hypothetical protein
VNIRDRKIKSEYGSELMRARFYAKVVVNGTSGCHHWQGCLQSRGYGQVRIDGVIYYAHRLGWELTRGFIPEGLNVLHKCDNPKCVNPEHLFLGTQKDNIRDMMAKRRHPRTKDQSKYTDEQRRVLKRKHKRRWYERNRAYVAEYNRTYRHRLQKG